MKDEALKIYCAMLAAGQQQGPKLMAEAMDQAEQFNREFNFRMEKAREEGRSKELEWDFSYEAKPVDRRLISEGLEALFPGKLCRECSGSGWVSAGVIRCKKVRCADCGGTGSLS